MSNTNPETGVAYGYISVKALAPWIYDDLIANGESLTHKQAWAEALEHERAKGVKSIYWVPDNDDINENAFETDFNNDFQPDEEVYAGETDGVKWQTSWLGGALNLWIFESPVMTGLARVASPCVPGAAILDVLDGHVQGYDVPVAWRREKWEYQVSVTATKIEMKADGFVGEVEGAGIDTVGFVMTLPSEPQPEDYYDEVHSALAQMDYMMKKGHFHVTFNRKIEEVG